MFLICLATKKPRKTFVFCRVSALEARKPRLQPTNQATTCRHQLPTTSSPGSTEWYQVVGSNFPAQNRPTNHQERATNQPKQQPTTDHQPPTTKTTNRPTNNRQPTNQQPSNQEPTTNQPTTNPPIPRIPKPKSQEPGLRWPGGMCRAPEYSDVCHVAIHCCAR